MKGEEVGKEKKKRCIERKGREKSAIGDGKEKRKDRRTKAV